MEIVNVLEKEKSPDTKKEEIIIEEEKDKDKKPEDNFERFSYSKLNVYETCAYRYKLTYVDKHFINDSSIANEFGTLVHYVEETIAKDIIANNNEPNFLIDDYKYIDLFINADIHNEDEDILGVKKLKEKYPEEFYKKDKSGMDYSDKANDYLNFGIYRLRDFLTLHRNIRILDVEKPFNLKYNDKYIFKGFIDRVLKDIDTGEIIIEDIKTWRTINNHNVITPLQFVFYSLAAQEIYGVKEDMISCFYDLPLAKNRCAAGTKGFIKRGCKKINNILEEIELKEFAPKPSPMCYWCIFSKTYPKQPKEAKNLCPYYSLYTPENKNFKGVDFAWMGLENHAAIMKEFLNRNKIEEMKNTPKEVVGEIVISSSTAATTSTIKCDENRFFLIRRR